MPSPWIALAGLSTLAYFKPWALIILVLSLFFLYSLWHFLWSKHVRHSYYTAVVDSDVQLPPSTKTRQLNVCVIGAGPSGIVATKELLVEGHKVTCYEKFDDLGGVFLYRENKGGVYDSTILTISNYLMAFSDFFPAEPFDCSPSSEPDAFRYRFWHHTEYLAYLKAYIAHFQLLERARFVFSATVTKVSREKQGKWRVVVSTKSGVEDRVFDAIAICNGTHQKPVHATYPGQDKSPVLFCHSETYKNASTDPRFVGKRVICVGAGETAADLVAEVAQVASATWMSMRRTPHVVPRNFWNLGLPGDAFSTRAMFYCNHDYVEKLHAQDQMLKLATAGPVGRKLFRGFLGLGDPIAAKVAELAERSGGGVVRQFLTKNDKFIPGLLDGSIVEKPAIERLDGRTVFFTDGSKVEKVDTVLLSTGYRDEFPFLNGVEFDSARALYKHAFHPDIGPSCVWIGFVRPSTGGVPACSEMVARYFALLCSNKRKLPDDWKARVAREKAAEEGVLTIHCNRVKSLVMWGDYMESMALHIGCQPNLLSFLFTNPLMWFRLLYGPMIPAQYRLRGPHAHPNLAKDLVRRVPLATPMPFSFLQSVMATLGWAGAILFDYRATSW